MYCYFRNSSICKNKKNLTILTLKHIQVLLID